ncbi:uncharacterized protein LOC129946804 [Eupeodes corollae]|uniref:uncharacterized protein LOC129946804 n=1 Tax=Eupeodes corollae TaxID=290404 RepID=UPI0024939FE9|nr:uncharacterized protein LOC129946804 [Eupeodes corollae]
MGRFSENDIIKFLELYKKSECLWKCNHKYYRIKSKRNEAYIRIRDAMNLASVLEVKQKIKSFRDTYASERTKVRRSMSRHSFNETYKPKLRWYNLADSFLNNPEGFFKVNLTVEDPHTRPDAIYSNSQSSQGYSMINKNPIVNQYPMPRVHAPNHYQYQNNNNSSLQQNQQNYRQIPDNPEPEKQHPIQSNEFYHFGMNIAMQLGSLPLVQALNVQTKIQQMLCEERIAYEQSRYEIIYDSNHSQLAGRTESDFVNNTQSDSISIESTIEKDNIKEEYLIDEQS